MNKIIEVVWQKFLTSNAARSMMVKVVDACGTAGGAIIKVMVSIWMKPNTRQRLWSVPNATATDAWIVHDAPFQFSLIMVSCVVIETLGV